MNVGELRAQLEDVPDEAEIILASDAEGNGYSFVAELEKTLEPYLDGDGDDRNVTWVGYDDEEVSPPYVRFWPI